MMQRVVVVAVLCQCASGLAPNTNRAFDTNAPRCPTNSEAQLAGARDSIVAATEAGVTRQIVRTMLTREDNRDLLIPLDETWTGGIMQLYRECSPLAKSLLRTVGEAREGKYPGNIREQRVDKSGVDGESLVVAEAEKALFDASCFVQPSIETLDPIVKACEAAGPKRLVMLFNPQFKELDDTLDFIASKSGLLGSLGNFLGGKADFMKIITGDIGFANTYSHQEIVVAGTRIRYFLAFPYCWQIYALSDDPAEPPIRLGEDTNRPDYNKIADLFVTNGIRSKLLRDTGQAKSLTQDVLTSFYEPECPPTLETSAASLQPAMEPEDAANSI